MITTLRALMKKVDNMEGQMNTVSKEMKILRKDYKKMLEVKNTNRNEE